MTDVTLVAKPVSQGKSGFSALLSMLWRDKLAFVSAVILVLIILCAVLGPALLGDMANSQNLRGRNSPPFDLARGWAFVLGGDSLGRPMLARLVVAARSTIMVASGAVLVSLAIGATLGLVAGYMGKNISQVIMRLADVIMSFPSLLIAVVVLYVLGPSIPNMILVLAIHFSRASDVIAPDHLTTDPAVPITTYRDGYGNWCSRLVAPVGRMCLSASGTVRDSQMGVASSSWFCFSCTK